MKHARTFTTAVLGALGGALIVAGYASRDSEVLGSPINAEIMSILGATLFGGAFISFIESVMGTDVSDIRNYLFKNEKFESAPDHFKVVAGKWHVYYITKKHGDLIWRNGLTHFNPDYTHNLLHGETKVVEVEGETPARTYSIEAGVRGDTLVIVNKAPDGTERDAIELVLGITKTYTSAFLGVQVLETWDGDDAITYSLYTRDPLIEGSIKEKASQDTLFEALEQVKSQTRIVDIGVILQQRGK